MDLITTLVSVPAIVGAVNLLKSLGLPGRWAAVFAVLIGAAIGAIAAVVQGTELPPGLLIGIVTGLSATGLYDVTAKQSPVE